MPRHKKAAHVCALQLKQPDADEAAKAVDAELLARYKRIKGRYAVPMAKVENNQCSGCNMSLPTSTVKRVATGEGIVECENCGRILYA